VWISGPGVIKPGGLKKSLAGKIVTRLAETKLETTKEVVEESRTVKRCR
jgi:hypothetical protein